MSIHFVFVLGVLGVLSLVLIMIMIIVIAVSSRRIIRDHDIKKMNINGGGAA